MNRKYCKYNKIINLKQNKPIIEIKNERTLFSGILLNNDKKIDAVSRQSEEVPNSLDILQLRTLQLYFKQNNDEIYNHTFYNKYL